MFNLLRVKRKSLIKVSKRMQYCITNILIFTAYF